MPAALATQDPSLLTFADVWLAGGIPDNAVSHLRAAGVAVTTRAEAQRAVTSDAGRTWTTRGTLLNLVLIAGLGEMPIIVLLAIGVFYIVAINTLAGVLSIRPVFLDVGRQAGKFEGRAAVSTWILAIARFKALSALRRKPEQELDEEQAEAIEDSSDTPDVTLEKKEKSEVMRQCLSSLSAEHREIIDLVYYHEKSVEEVAGIVGIPEATVKTRMFYARKKLADLLEAAGVERGWP